MLDANVLVAVVVADHVHHTAAEEWFQRTTEPFGTCPITQGALLRLLMRQGASVDQAIQALEGVTAHPRHESWPDDIAYDASMLAGIVGHRQVTDAYLVALAAHHSAALATFDQGLAALHPQTTALINTS